MKRIICLLICCVANHANADLVPVFFAGGQSNARPWPWAAAIQTELRSNHDPNSVVVALQHSGNWMVQWVDKGVPQQNYIDDAAAVRNVLNNIAASGDTPDFRGLFWFQGEGDTGSYSHMDSYTSRFNSMIDHYKTDFVVANLFVTLMVIDADLRFPLPPGRTPASVEYMRAIHFQLGEQPNMIAMDTRSYTRRDVWHVETQELARLGQDAAQLYVKATTVPEPSGFGLLTGFLLRRKRKR